MSKNEKSKEKQTETSKPIEENKVIMFVRKIKEKIEGLVDYTKDKYEDFNYWIDEDEEDDKFLFIKEKFRNVKEDMKESSTKDLYLSSESYLDEGWSDENLNSSASKEEIEEQQRIKEEGIHRRIVMRNKHKEFVKKFEEQ